MKSIFDILALITISFCFSLTACVLSDVCEIMSDYDLLKQNGFRIKTRGLETFNKMIFSFPIVLGGCFFGYILGYLLGSLLLLFTGSNSDMLTP